MVPAAAAMCLAMKRPPSLDVAQRLFPKVNFFLVSMPAAQPGEYGDYYCISTEFVRVACLVIEIIHIVPRLPKP